MKALRYLLMVIIVALVSVTVHAQFTAPFKNSQNQPVFNQQAKTGYASYTTSTLMGDGSISLMNSGSRLPIAARNGVVVSGSVPGDDTPVNDVGHPGRPRRTVGDDGFEDDGDPENMDESFPVGDGMWVLMILALGYGAYKTRMRRKATA